MKEKAKAKGNIISYSNSNSNKMMMLIINFWLPILYCINGFNKIYSYNLSCSCLV